jgi:nucleotide-binding universal stress UspA family protein
VPLLILREERSLALAPGTQADRTIRALVPLESSVSAKSALAPAARLVAALAAPARGALHLVQVVVPPGGLESSQSESNALARKAQRFLESIVEDLHHGLITPQVAEFHLSLSCSVTLDDDIAAGIARLAEEGADVIVMAPHEFYGMPQWAVGSITERVLHTSRLPLFIVPR